MSGVRRSSGGPAAAEANRAAVVAAAREVFAESGFDAPLRLIARRAGVESGELHRHFPDRESIALAVFEENIAGVEALSALSSVSLDTVLSLMVDQIIGSIGFIVMLDPFSLEDPRLAAANARLRLLLADKLADAQAAGTLRPELTIDDLVLMLAMLAALLTRTPLDSRPVVGRRAWRLVLYGLRAAPEQP